VGGEVGRNLERRSVARVPGPGIVALAGQMALCRTRAAHPWGPAPPRRRGGDAGRRARGAARRDAARRCGGGRAPFSGWP
jgi:hypothetical protein